MKILITGAAGFIGYHAFKKFRKAGYDVTGLDNINDYYDINLKLGRLRDCGFDTDTISTGHQIESKNGGRFIKMDLILRDEVEHFFKKEQFDIVCHLAAQPGVRYSIKNPYAYIDNNIATFLNILEGCRHNNIKHLIYASSSSVYGANSKIPFSVDDCVDYPISLYAATKKSNELMAHCYSHLYNFPTTGLRFFTVYGPWGRADMALYKFTHNIFAGEPIKVYNHGDMQRDFTYIDDIIEGIFLVAEKGPVSQYKIYNIGNGKPVQLMDFINAIERATGKKAKLDLQPLQPGDVYATWADTTDLKMDFGYQPDTGLEEGVSRYVGWYKEFYKMH